MTQTVNELTLLVESSGLEVSKQNQIAESLGVFFNKAAEWDATIQSIVITSPEETGKMKMAKEGRLTLKNMRLESEKVVKAKREEVKYRMANDVLEDKLWLKAGQMIEATFKNLETKLEEKEKFAERWESKRKEELKTKRIIELQPYLEFVAIDFIDFGSMGEEEYIHLLDGAKLQLQGKIETEKRLEEERIKKEKAEAEAREKMRIENERLKAEAIEKEKQLAKERAKAEADRKAVELKARKEKEAIELKAKKEKEILDAKLNAEKLANEKLQTEIRVKAEAEKRRQAELKEKEELGLRAKQRSEKEAQSAPDKSKLINLAVTLDNMVLPEVKSDGAKKIISEVKILLVKVSTFIKDKSKNI